MTTPSTSTLCRARRRSSLGAFAMEISTGNGNTAIGKQALFSNTTGGYNTTVGGNAGTASST